MPVSAIFGFSAGFEAPIGLPGLGLFAGAASALTSVSVLVASLDGDSSAALDGGDNGDALPSTPPSESPCRANFDGDSTGLDGDNPALALPDSFGT